MTWVLYFLVFKGSWGLFYGGDFVTQKQCEAMAHRVEIVAYKQRPNDFPFEYICVQKPEEK